MSGETHMSHCNLGDYEGTCKYGEDDCPAINEPVDEIEGIIEEGYAKMMLGFFKLRRSGQYQREYDTMGHIINLLMEDRQHLRKTYKINI